MSTTGEKRTIKNTNIWRLNNTLLNNQQITEEIKKEIKIWIETNENKNTIVVGDTTPTHTMDTPLTPMDRSTKQKINKETQTLNDTIDQLDLIDIYRTFYPKTMNFTFSSSAHEPSPG